MPAVREPFSRPLALRGWSADSAWGYDPVLESYWAALDGPAGRVVVAPDHLLVTLGTLAAALGRAAGVPARDVYLALTCAAAPSAMIG